MATSQNGWPAYEGMAVVPLDVNGARFVPGVKPGDVATVLGYVAQQVNDRVEPAVDYGCWGYSYRPNRNDPSSLSNHSSGTAIDYNAPRHPNGIPTRSTWTATQVDEIHKILAEVDGAVRWGGDYTGGTPDAMHFEVNVSPAALAVVAHKIRTSGDDMPYTEKQLTQITRAAVAAELEAVEQQISVLTNEVAKQKTRTLNARDAQKRILKRLGVTDDKLDAVLDELEAAQ